MGAKIGNSFSDKVRSLGSVAVFKGTGANSPANEMYHNGMGEFMQHCKCVQFVGVIQYLQLIV